jgi:hypothetical protein
MEARKWKRHRQCSKIGRFAGYGTRLLGRSERLTRLGYGNPPNINAKSSYCAGNVIRRIGVSPPVNAYDLNEAQAIFIASLLDNNELVLDFKKMLAHIRFVTVVTDALRHSLCGFVLFFTPSL